ncbi:MAG: hypothetical protein QOH91_214 [Mycobacterium sp.]|nr:hypothetical protein [Mycobacterium sp.]
MNKVIVVVCAIAMAVALSGCSRSSPNDEYQAALSAARDWIARNPNEWVLKLDQGNSLSRPAWSKPCSENPDTKSVTLRYGDSGGTTEVDLSFKCPIGAGATVSDLSRTFSYAVLQHLPHGISAPNWKFDILTPASSLEQGVTFSQPAAGQLLVTIDTPMFAVHGHSTTPKCQPPADAPSPAGCFLQLEHRIPLRLALTAPFTGAELG